MGGGRKQKAKGHAQDKCLLSSLSLPEILGFIDFITIPKINHSINVLLLMECSETIQNTTKTIVHHLQIQKKVEQSSGEAIFVYRKDYLKKIAPENIQKKLLRCRHTELQLLDELQQGKKKRKSFFFFPLV